MKKEEEKEEEEQEEEENYAPGLIVDFNQDAVKGIIWQVIYDKHGNVTNYYISKGKKKEDIKVANKKL